MLQARPVTSLDQIDLQFEYLHESDQGMDSEIDVLSKANVGSVLKQQHDRHDGILIFLAALLNIYSLHLMFVYLTIVYWDLLKWYSYKNGRMFH